MSRRHRAKINRWENGKLKVEELIFNSYDEAIIWVSNSGVKSVKIYDDEGNLIFSAGPEYNEMYAAC